MFFCWPSKSRAETNGQFCRGDDRRKPQQGQLASKTPEFASQILQPLGFLLGDPSDCPRVRYSIKTQPIHFTLQTCQPPPISISRLLQALSHRLPPPAARDDRPPLSSAHAHFSLLCPQGIEYYYYYSSAGWESGRSLGVRVYGSSPPHHEDPPAPAFCSAAKRSRSHYFRRYDASVWQCHCCRQPAGRQQSSALVLVVLPA